LPICKFYGGITREELELLRRDLEKEGISVPPGDEVAVTGQYGIELSITYDGARETLKVCISKKPFYIPEAMVWQIIDAGVEPYEGP
jgi:hypothetical protein